MRQINRLKNCFWTIQKTNDYSAQSEKAEEVVAKNKNNLNEKLWEKMENSCQMWSQICIRNFIPASFFNEWLEKHGIVRNQFQEPQLYQQPEEFYS